MLSINWSDVMAVIQSIVPQLVVIGAFLVLALVLTIAVNKRTVKDWAVRKLVHSAGWIAACTALIISVGTMLYGPLNTLVSQVGGVRYQLSDETVSQTKQFAIDAEGEGIVLLKNDGSTLPLRSNKVNVFGWASSNPVYGGTGSGSMNAQYPTTSLIQGLNDAGIETNSELTDFYTQYCSTRPKVGMMGQDWTLPEPPASTYGDDLINDAKEYSDTAVIVLARSGGEGADLPADMGAIIKHERDYAPDASSSRFGSTEVYYNENSDEYSDWTPGQGYLDATKSERDMIDLVCSNFDNVVLVYNGANALNLSFVEDCPQIKGVVWAPPAGQTGFDALGSILKGDVNPSGRATDTFLRDFSQAPWHNNIGSYQYTNMSDYHVDQMFGSSDPTYVNYVEGIYVGYKYYETAAAEGVLDYDAAVQYPFGYGLSYTTFSQEMGPVTADGDSVSFDVTVTNIGDVAGKDVVEVYYNPPYTNGGIEKATANLVHIDKTKVLGPGESQVIKVTFDKEDMASYDSKGAQAYVLEQGDYAVSINSDSHTAIQSATVTIPSTITYSGDNKRSVDQTAATNEFQGEYGEGDGSITYLSRADHFANRDQALAAPGDTALNEQYKAGFVNASNYRQGMQDDPNATAITTGAHNGVQLYQLYGKDYDDPLWDQLLDELTLQDMGDLISFAGYNNAAVNAIGKPRQSDVDGPAALNNNFTGAGSIGFPASVAIANTFNPQIAYQYGEYIAQMAKELNVTGWYAPAMNIHRSPYAGRNFEYFSEDGYLSGIIAAQECKGASDNGVYPFMKHFALNDQETNRTNMLCTWASEQAIREVYLKPFQMSVTDGHATAVMSSFNYIGTQANCRNSHLLNDVLRGEWGFRGFVETDYYSGYGYQNANLAIRNGNDAMLATTQVQGDATNVITDTDNATTQQAMRTAAHNILYTAANSWLYANGTPQLATAPWEIAFRIVAIGGGVILALLLVLAIRRFLRRRAGPQGVRSGPGAPVTGAPAGGHPDE